MPASRVDIDLSAIERNLGLVRQTIAPRAGDDSPKLAKSADARSSPKSHQVGICAVLKQDAYGAGAIRVAKRLVASGVDMVAVYGLDEARTLAEAVSTVPILVLMPVHGVDRMDPLYRHAAAGRLHLTLHGMDQFQGVQEMAGRIGAPIPVHVQVDAGLSRGGAGPEQAAKLVEAVVNSQKIRLGGLMTHFSSPCCDDAFTREQARVFRDFVETIKPAIKSAVEHGGKAVSKVNELVVHAANSCAMFRSRSYHGTMVRVGQSLLGYCGFEVPKGEHFEFREQMDKLAPSVRWLSCAVHTQEIPPGWPVGYGSTWRAPHRADGRKTRIALIPVGYADGYPRTLGGKGNGGPGYVGFTGRLYERRGGAEGDDAGRQTSEGAAIPTVYAPVVGRVSMDQITVDVTDVPEMYLRSGRSGNEPANPEVEIYSRTPGTKNYLPELAERAGSITHELLTRISARVERVYRIPAQTTETQTSGVVGQVRLGTSTRAGGIGGATAVAQ